MKAKKILGPIAIFIVMAALAYLLITDWDSDLTPFATKVCGIFLCIVGALLSISAFIRNIKALRAGTLTNEIEIRIREGAEIKPRVEEEVIVEEAEFADIDIDDDEDDEEDEAEDAADEAK